MFRLILIYAYDEEAYAPREYTERVFAIMTDLVSYLDTINERNIHRVIIERVS